MLDCILSTNSKYNLNELNRNINESYNWLPSAERILTDICKVKMSQLTSVNNALHESIPKYIVYAEENERWFSCGLHARLTPLCDPESYPGNNKLGSIWSNLI